MSVSVIINRITSTLSNQWKKKGCDSPYFIITDLINILKKFRACPILNKLSVIGFPKGKTI